MKKFKNIRSIIEKGLVQLSIRHMRRKAKELFNKEDESVIVIKNSKRKNEYYIDINSLEKFERKRAHKKIQSKSVVKENDSIKKRIILNPYDTSISINIKYNDVSKIGNYDYNYNKFLAETISHKLNKDIYYSIEKEDSSLNHFHLHIGLKRGESSLQIIKKSIENLLWENFLISNDSFTDYSRDRRSILYVENMISDYAHKEYISKGSDKLGGVAIIYLSASNSYTKAS